MAIRTSLQPLLRLQPSVFSQISNVRRRNLYHAATLRRLWPDELKLRSIFGIVEGSLDRDSPLVKIYILPWRHFHWFGSSPQKLGLGIEITGALARNLGLSKGQLQVRVGGNYKLRENPTLH